jgi:hypothetical protein
VRCLASRGLVRGIEIGSSRWCDIDTKNDLAMAEEMLALAPAK